VVLEPCHRQSFAHWRIWRISIRLTRRSVVTPFPPAQAPLDQHSTLRMLGIRGRSHFRWMMPWVAGPRRAQLRLPGAVKSGPRFFSLRPSPWPRVSRAGEDLVCRQTSTPSWPWRSPRPQRYSDCVPPCLGALPWSRSSPLVQVQHTCGSSRCGAGMVLPIRNNS